MTRPSTDRNPSPTSARPESATDATDASTVTSRSRRTICPRYFHSWRSPVTAAKGPSPNLSADPREGMQTMTGYIATTAGGENPVGSTSYNTLFAVGLALFALTLVINVVSVRLVRRHRQEY